MDDEKETIEEKENDDKDSKYDNRLESDKKDMENLRAELDDYKEKYENERKEHEKVKNEYETFKAMTKESFWTSASNDAKEEQNEDIIEDNSTATKSFDDLFAERSEY